MEKDFNVEIKKAKIVQSIYYDWHDDCNCGHIYICSITVSLSDATNPSKRHKKFEIFERIQSEQPEKVVLEIAKKRVLGIVNQYVETFDNTDALNTYALNKLDAYNKYKEDHLEVIYED